ncbi:Casein kinase II subunit beta [Babesia sp. Xinjiang]|uniref:Casein kinase II subunit beta n=1 Tax=Babesia sp. Xinjiang TaxID=462227 RepID=UPI000A259502|nr:Casein kinase II subunit beta [Babesia sp. Xinjiang]ORM39526.1 Casein kinase II subunit beta [Babesia sp. Xinjiang]
MIGSVFLNEAEKSSDDLESSDDQHCEMPWIEWYCSLKGNEYYVQVDADYIRDEFNLVGLQHQVSYYSHAIRMILDNYDDFDYDCYDDNDGDSFGSRSDRAKQQIINTSSQLLYGLIHSRFIITSKGMSLMMQKFKEKVFGTCPNFSCENAAVLPIGIVDAPAYDNAKIFCPRCNEVYHPPKSSRLSLIDGAYFGTTFAHLFLMVHDALVARGPAYYYVPQIYGFKVSPSVKNQKELPQSNQQ